jgi:hypothetical protein
MPVLRSVFRLPLNINLSLDKNEAVPILYSLKLIVGQYDPALLERFDTSRT